MLKLDLNINMVDPGPQFQKKTLKQIRFFSIFGLGYASTTLTTMCYTQIEVSFETTPYTSEHVTQQHVLFINKSKSTLKLLAPHLGLGTQTTT